MPCPYDQKTYFSASIAASARVRLACSRPVASYLAKRRIPGLAISVVKDGQVVRSQGHGLASVELDVPVTERAVLVPRDAIMRTGTRDVVFQFADGHLTIPAEATSALPS